jgi:hypothetical protein
VVKSRVIFFRLVVSVIRSTPLFIRSYPPNTFLLSGHGSSVTELSIQNNISLLMPAKPYQEMLTEINISLVKTRQHTSTRRSAVCETRHNKPFLAEYNFQAQFKAVD